MPLTDSSVNQPHTESREYRSSPPPEREKSVYIAKSVPKSKNPDTRKNVEVLYDDGKWYRGWLDSFNLRWVVKFQHDNETAEVLFPDKDVRLYKYFFHILIYTLCYPSNEPIIMKPIHHRRNLKLSFVTNVDRQISSIRFFPPHPCN